MEFLFKRLHANARMPARAYNSAGYDLFPVGEGFIYPQSMVKIPLGFAMSFDTKYVALIYDKSSTGAKGIIHLSGVVDADFRGEWVVILHNTGDEIFKFSPAKSVAQVLFHEIAHPTLVEVDELPPSERGDKKEGSSGN